MHKYTIAALLYGLCFFVIAAQNSSTLKTNITQKPILLNNAVDLRGAMQPCIVKKRFFNNDKENMFTHFIDAIKIFWATKTSWSSYYADYHDSWIKKDTPIEQAHDFEMQWIGHASFLLQVNNCNIITDPVFYDLNPILYPRKTSVGIDPENLPPIHIVMISHNHRDHLDERSMQFLKKFQPLCLVPEGTKEWFIQRGFDNVLENTWWQNNTVGYGNSNIEFTFVPAVHWSGRTALDFHSSLWGGWLIKANNKTLYFAGDTGFQEELFKKIADYAQKIDCALLPIGPCEPRNLMKHSHMSPEEAVKAFNVLNASTFVPMHWGTFALGPDSFEAPIKLLRKAWENNSKSTNKLLYPIKFGERVTLYNLLVNQKNL